MNAAQLFIIIANIWIVGMGIKSETSVWWFAIIGTIYLMAAAYCAVSIPTTSTDERR